jgi:arsenite-transporting ATPase
MTMTRTQEGVSLRIALPFVAKADVDLARLRQRGDELVVTVGSYRRLLALPAALSRSAIAGARVVDGALVVRFVTDPETCT